jgi:hypothetical protein
MAIVLRKWTFSNPLYELRGFVNNYELNAVTQYVEDIKIDWLI